MKMTFEEKVKTFLFKTVVWRGPYSVESHYSKVVRISDDYITIQCGLGTQQIKVEWVIHVSSCDLW